MLRRRLTVLLAAVLVVGACTRDEPSTTRVPEVVTSGGEPTESATPTTRPTQSAAPTSSPPSSSTTSTAPSTSTQIPLDETTLEAIPVADSFEQPVLALSPAGDERLYVVDQPGRIWVVDLESESVGLFVDLTSDVVFGGERGLLGLAFHPDFAANGRLFVNYTGNSGQTRIVELSSPDGGVSADAATQQVLLEIEQPARNHNGGMIAFGPDGLLWIATGDGGGADDRFNQGQRPDTLLAALLRIDVSSPGEYSIPAGNPFVDGGGAPEVIAFGLRNPWRFAFSGTTLYIADVGQRDWEEINVLSIEGAIGANFGWPNFEGDACFRGPCEGVAVVSPVHTYSHSEGCSITGGFVYAGDLMPQLRGHYFFGDFCGGWVRSLDREGQVFEWLEPSSDRSITSFGQDAAGELYLTLRTGELMQLVPAGS